MRGDLAEEPLRFWCVCSYLILCDPDSRPLEGVRVSSGSFGGSWGGGSWVSSDELVVDLWEEERAKFGKSEIAVLELAKLALEYWEKRLAST